MRALAKRLEERGGFKLNEGFVDATLASAEKRGAGVGKTRPGKGTKIMAITDGRGLPLAVNTAIASPHETKLIEGTLDEAVIDTLPLCLIGD